MPRSMNIYTLAFVLISSTSPAVLAGELSLDVPSTASKEWRDLSAEYRGQLDKLEWDRKERGEKAQTVREKLDQMDWAKTTAQAEADLQEGLQDMGESLGDAAVEYFKGPGKRDNVIDAGVTIITETLPALNQVYEAAWAPVDFEYEMDDLKTELAQHDREISKFDKKIEQLREEIRLSDKIADIYQSQEAAFRKQRKELSFKISKVAQNAKDKSQDYHDRVPNGWQKCNCPQAHSSVGRVIQGDRYHAPGPQCP